MVSEAFNRRSAESMAESLPRSWKCFGVNTHPLPLPKIRLRTDKSMDRACFDIGVLTEIVACFSVKTRFICWRKEGHPTTAGRRRSFPANPTGQREGRWCRSPRPLPGPFPADIPRDTQISLLRPDFLNWCDAGEAGQVSREGREGRESFSDGFSFGAFAASRGLSER